MARRLIRLALEQARRLVELLDVECHVHAFFGVPGLSAGVGRLRDAGHLVEAGVDFLESPSEKFRFMTRCLQRAA